MSRPAASTARPAAAYSVRLLRDDPDPAAGRGDRGRGQLVEVGRADGRPAAARQRDACDGGQAQLPGRRPGDQGGDPEGLRAARGKAGVPGDPPGRGHALAAGRQELQTRRQGLGDLEVRRGRDAGVAHAHRVGEPVTCRRRGSAIGDADGQPGCPGRRNRRGRA